MAGYAQSSYHRYFPVRWAYRWSSVTDAMFLYSTSTKSFALPNEIAKNGDKILDVYRVWTPPFTRDFWRFFGNRKQWFSLTISPAHYRNPKDSEWPSVFDAIFVNLKFLPVTEWHHKILMQMHRLKIRQNGFQLLISFSGFWRNRRTVVLMPTKLHRVAKFRKKSVQSRTGKWLQKHRFLRFLQRVSIASYAERCISHDRFCLTVWPSVWPSVTVRYHAKTTPATIMRSSLEDSPMTLVSWRLTSARNSKRNIGSEGAEWERGSKNLAKIGNF